MNCRSDGGPEFRKVIRHRETHAFFAYGRWSEDYCEAQKFTDTLSLLQMQQRHRLKNIELVLVLGDRPSREDIVLPLG